MAYKVYSVRMSSEVLERIRMYNEVREMYRLKKVQVGEFIADAVQRAIVEDLDNIERTVAHEREVRLASMTKELQSPIYDKDIEGVKNDIL